MTTPNTKHTPGPWFTCEQVKQPHPHALVGIGNGSTHVAYVSVTPANAFEADANARLIAAAPDLLAALRNCVETLDAAKQQANGGCEWIASIEARAAIAKAEGGQ